MSSQSLEVIKKISPKLGINDDDIINKAFSYLREVNAKSKIALNEMVKIIICLDIATAQLGANFDKPAALKLTVLNKPNYQKNYLLIKNLLQVENKKSIKEICIQLSCEEASKMAEKLLQVYKENDIISRDFNHPQYSVAAVYTICRLNKISVKKSDFITLSTLKPQQWAKLETEFMKFAEDNEFKCDMMRKTPRKKRGNELLNIIEEKTKDIEKENEKIQIKEKEIARKIESYEEWKQRILDEAYFHLNKANKQ